MKATNATLYFGSKVAKLSALEVCADRAVFDSVDGVVSTYARLTFKVGGNWFDAEGVVLARGCGTCELRFATMAAVVARRLDQATREIPKQEAAHQHPAAVTRTRRNVIALPA
jgi:hypothetical protein